MSFLEDDELSAPDRSGNRRPASDHQRQILVRRLIALAVGVGIVILLLLGVRGCLDARKERGFENYRNDLNSIAQSSNQVSLSFFEQLQNPPENVDEIELQADISSARNTATADLKRVEGLDAPDELAGAQGDLEQAFELRRDALGGIAEDIPTATAAQSDPQSRNDAVDRIAADMRTLLASDVLYERAREEVSTVLADEGIAGDVEASQFLPDPIELWLDDLTLSSTLSGFATSTGSVKGIHGLELVSTTAAPGNVVLTPGSENSIVLDGETPSFEVEVLNGGESEERGIPVTFELSGAATRIEAEAPIASIDPGGTETLTVELDEPPETGVPLSLEVTVQFVLGETILDNNTESYTVIFEE